MFMNSILDIISTMAIIPALHIIVKGANQASIRQEEYGVVHITIPSAYHQSNLTLDIDNLHIVLSNVQNHWKIEGKLMVSIFALFQ